MGISGFGDEIGTVEEEVNKLGFNSLWELAGLVTGVWFVIDGSFRWFQFPMGISGFGDLLKSLVAAS